MGWFAGGDVILRAEGDLVEERFEWTAAGEAFPEDVQSGLVQELHGCRHPVDLGRRWRRRLFSMRVMRMSEAQSG